MGQFHFVAEALAKWIRNILITNKLWYEMDLILKKMLSDA